MKPSDLYTCQRTGAGRNDFRLTLRTIETRDAAPTRSRGPGLPLFGPNDSVRTSTRRERGMTRDETLTPQTSGQTISRGTYWDGTGVNAKLDAKVGPIRDFVSGFIPNNIVHAVDPGVVIDLGRTYTPRLQDEEAREAMTRALDEAEEEWRNDERSARAATTFRPGTQRAEAERYRQRSDGALSSAMYPRPTDAPHNHGPAADLPVTDAARGLALFAAARSHTQDYAAALKKGRETAAPTAPAKVKTAADYAANLAAGRAAKRGS
jgi:hypothetical protein